MKTNDSHETIFPGDPRITAYAFGELEGDELKLIEAAVAADPELQAVVAELRSFGDTLAGALADEKAETTNASAPEPVVVATPKKRRGRLIPFPLHYLATAMAACFAVVVWLRHEPEATKLAKQVSVETKEVPLDKTAPMPVASRSTPEHRAQVARMAVASPVASPVDASKLAVEPEAIPMPPLPESPSMPLTSFAFAEAPKNTGTVIAAGPTGLGSGAGFSSKLDTVAGEVRLRRSMAAVPAPSPASSMMVAGYVSEPSAQPSFGYVYDRPMVTLPGAESYASQADNSQRSVATEPLSTFSIDVDTASYSNVRRFLTGGRLPPRDAVRIEELINYFPYRYAPPVADAKAPVPFAAHLEVASAPWAPTHRLVRIALKGREFTTDTRPPANLVFLLDVSGSMNAANKLPLVKESLRLLVERLRPDDRVAIVTYAGHSGLALPSTPASQKRDILAALDNLNAGGSTNGAMGIHLAYDIAKANRADGGINRVILCTDGDFNVGVTDRGELVNLIQEKARSKVFLSVFGFGMGNLKDNTLESLADKGNGSYGYIDTRREAEKVFVEQAEGTLATIAKDVKIQVEFNPARVQSYRLIGYENRMLKKEDFNNDAIDAGEIGAGHTVTALYEIVPVGVDDDGTPRPEVDPLKYQKPAAGSRSPEVGGRKTESRELLTVKIRYKQPEGDVSAKQEFPLIDGGQRFEQASGEFKFAASVAAWGMLLRDSAYKGSATFDQVLGWAEDGLGDDAGGYRAEFIQLVRRSAGLSAR